MPVVLGAVCGVASGAFEHGPASSPRTTGLGGAGVALAGDAWASRRNPALTVWGVPQAGMAWSQQFGLPELGREAVCVTGSAASQPWSVNAATFGSDLYRESQFGVSIARELHSTVAVGVSAAGNWLHVQNYGQGSALTLDAGVVARPVSGVSVGAAAMNLNRPRLSHFRDRAEPSLIAGSAVRIGAEGTVAADLVFERRFRPEWRVGAEAQVLKELSVRVGARAEPVRPSAGVGIQARGWLFEYAVDLHPDLGASHEVGLLIPLHR